MKRPPRGLYRRRRRDGTPGEVWWCFFYVRGRRQPVQESTGTSDIEEAKRYLAGRLAEHPRARRERRLSESILVRDALDLYEQNARDQGRAVHQALWRGLRYRLGALRLVDLRRADLDETVRDWKLRGIPYEGRDERRNPRHPVSGSTCNRGMTMLRRARNLVIDKLGVDLPRLTFPHFTEPVKGRYIPPETFARILGGIQHPVKRAFIELAYLVGVRSGQLKRTELRNVRVQEGRVVALVYDAEQVKNRTPHEVPLVERAQEIVQGLWEGRRLGCPLFHVEGHALGSLRSEWRRACRLAGVPVGRKAGGVVLYNCRHSALTNLAAAGTPDSVARSISGHRTASVHARYQITQEAMKIEALTRMTAHVTRAQRG